MCKLYIIVYNDSRINICTSTYTHTHIYTDTHAYRYTCKCLNNKCTRHFTLISLYRTCGNGSIFARNSSTGWRNTSCLGGSGAARTVRTPCGANGGPVGHRPKGGSAGKASRYA